MPGINVATGSIVYWSGWFEENTIKYIQITNTTKISNPHVETQRPLWAYGDHTDRTDHIEIQKKISLSADVHLIAVWRTFARIW